MAEPTASSRRTRPATTSDSRCADAVGCGRHARLCGPSGSDSCMGRIQCAAAPWLGTGPRSRSLRRRGDSSRSMRGASSSGGASASPGAGEAVRCAVRGSGLRPSVHTLGRHVSPGYECSGGRCSGGRFGGGTSTRARPLRRASCSASRSSTPDAPMSPAGMWRAGRARFPEKKVSASWSTRVTATPASGAFDAAFSTQCSEPSERRCVT